MKNPRSLYRITSAIENDNPKELLKALGRKSPNMPLKIIGYSFFTPLLYAARLGKIEVLRILLDNKGVNMNSFDNYGCNALHNAISSRNQEAILLIKKHIDPQQVDDNGNGWLHYAAMEDPATLKLVQNQFGNDINRQNKFGETAWHWVWAAQNEEALENLQFLLDQGADATIADNEGNLPLHHAAMQDLPKVVEALMTCCDKRQCNSGGETPLDLAETLGSQWESARLLVDIIEEEVSEEFEQPTDSIPIAEEVSEVVSEPAESEVPQPIIDLAKTVPIEDAQSKLQILINKNSENLTIDISKLADYGIDHIKHKELIFRDELGRGGFGTVYRASLRDNWVAVKVLNAKLEDKTVREFIKEIESWVKVRHHHFLLTEGICVDNQLCIITELAMGGNLAEAVEQKKLNYLDKCRIAIQIAEGMNFIHNKNPPIIHRDLKPQNILLDRFNQVKIADFGLSRQTKASATAMTFKLESTEIFTGTVRYMAPELYDENPQWSRATDIWAFGCILLFLFTGQVPWEGIEIFGVQRNLVFKNQLPIPESLPENIADVIRNWTKIVPEERSRFPQIKAMLEAMSGTTSSQMNKIN